MKKVALVTGSSRGIGRAIAIRLAKDGYRVIVHGAGNVDKANEVKDIITSNGGEAEVITADLCDLKATKDFCSNSIPVGFYGEPDDCAGIVSLLCSEEGRYITGQSIYVDGGKSVQ